MKVSLLNLCPCYRLAVACSSWKPELGFETIKEQSVAYELDTIESMPIPMCMIWLDNDGVRSFA